MTTQFIVKIIVFRWEKIKMMILGLKVFNCTCWHDFRLTENDKPL